MFFIDLDGAEDEPPVAEAIEALRGKAETVRILGSYPVASPTGFPGLATDAHGSPSTILALWTRRPTLT